MAMKFPSWLQSKDSDLRRAEHFLKNSEHIRLPVEAEGTQQNSSQASARHSGSNTFKNYQIYYSLCEEWKLWRMLTFSWDWEVMATLRKPVGVAIKTTKCE